MDAQRQHLIAEAQRRVALVLRQLERDLAAPVDSVDIVEIDVTRVIDSGRRVLATVEIKVAASHFRDWA